MTTRQHNDSNTNQLIALEFENEEDGETSNHNG
jgi:hypothetical protein